MKFLLMLAIALLGCSTSGVFQPLPITIQGEITRVIGGTPDSVTVALLGTRDRVRPDINGRFELVAPIDHGDLTLSIETPDLALRTELDDIPDGTSTIRCKLDLLLNQHSANIGEIEYLSVQGTRIIED